MVTEQLCEHLKTCKNLVETALLLANLGQEHLLPTILEIACQEIEDIVLEYSVEG